MFASPFASAACAALIFSAAVQANLFRPRQAVGVVSAFGNAPDLTATVATVLPSAASSEISTGLRKDDATSRTTILTGTHSSKTPVGSTVITTGSGSPSSMTSTFTSSSNNDKSMASTTTSSSSRSTGTGAAATAGVPIAAGFAALVAVAGALV